MRLRRADRQLDLPLLTRAGERKTCRLEIRPQPDAEPGFAVLMREIGPEFDSPIRGRRARGDTRAAHRANLALIGGEPGWIGLGLEAEIRHVSPQAADCLALVDREWVGRPLTDLFTPADADDWYLLLHRTVETGRPQQAVVGGGGRCAGDVCWPVTVLALHDEAEHTLLGFTLTLGAPEKSTDRRTAPSVGGEQSAERAWFHAVVHDLREPLRRVREYVETLRYDDTVALGARAADYLGRIDAAVERLQDNVGGILRLARIDTAPFVPERIDLGVLIADGARRSRDARARSWRRCRNRQSRASVSGDPVQLRLLFQNLIDNSIRYRRPDVPPRIVITRLDADPGHGMLRLRYVDNARGFEDPGGDAGRPTPRCGRGHRASGWICAGALPGAIGATLDIAETHSTGHDLHHHAQLPVGAGRDGKARRPDDSTAHQPDRGHGCQWRDRRRGRHALASAGRSALVQAEYTRQAHRHGPAHLRINRPGLAASTQSGARRGSPISMPTGVEVVDDFETAVARAVGAAELMVIGGAQIYALACRRLTGC